MSPIPNILHNIRNWRQKNKVPPISPKEIIPDECDFHKVIESVIKDWICAGTIKCGLDLHY